MFLVNCTLAPLPHIASYCHRFITLHVLLCYFACNLFEFGSLSGYCTLIAGTFCPSVDAQVLHNMSEVVNMGDQELSVNFTNPWARQKPNIQNSTVQSS